MDQNLSAEIKDFFLRKQKIAIVILFGSHASGHAHADSDVDIGCAGSERLTVEEILSLSAELSLHLGKEVDLVDMRGSHGALLQEILVRGVMLINHDVALYEQLIQRMLREKEDDSRFLAKIVEERKKAWSLQTKL